MAHQQRQGDDVGPPLADVVPLPVGLGYVPAATPGAPTVGQPPMPAPPAPDAEDGLGDGAGPAEERTRVLTGRVLPVVPAAATPVLRALRPDRLAWAIVRHEIYYGTLGTARGLWALWTWATARELDAHLATQPRLVLDARQRRQRIAWAGLGATTAAGAVVWWTVGPVAIVAALLAVLAVAGGVERAVRHQLRPRTEDQPPPVETGRAEEVALPRLLGVSPTESRIIARLDRWDALAAARGLDGLSLVDLRASEAGLVATLDLSGRWTAARVAAPDTVGRIRAALSVPNAVRADVVPGDVGDEVELRIRTRERRPDALWTPDRAGSIGVDTDTGQAVPIPPGRLLVAGTSGAGKSVALRVLMASALLAEEPTAVIYLDGKGEESSLWLHNVRVAVEPDEVDQAITEVTEEAHERRDLMRANRVATWTPTEERPRLVVVVDEGAEIIAMDDRRRGLVDRLCSLARVGRSRRIDVVWCTQKPTIGDGIPRQVNGVMDTRLVLRTAGATETRQVLGPEWRAHELTGAGLAYLVGTGRGPDQPPIQVWDLSADATVTALPDREPWQHGQADTEEAQGADDGERELALTVLTEMARAQLVSGLVPAATVRDLLPDMTDVQRANYLTGLGCERGRTGSARGWRIDSVQAALQRLRDRR